MKVSLIYYTGMGMADPLFGARLLAYTKATRMEQGEEGFASFLAKPAADLKEELAYIANTIRSSWEFIDFHFQVTGVTRAFTHQLVRTRTGSYAQQTQRMIDASGAAVEMPESVRNNPVARAAWEQGVTTMMEAYREMQGAGIPNQDARGILPTNVHTSIIVKFNLRTLADIVGKRENLRAQGEYADVARAMAREAIEVMPWITPFLYPERKATPALDALLKEVLGDRSPTDVPGVAAALKDVDKLKETWG